MQLPEPLKQDLKDHKVFPSINLLYWKMPPPIAGALDWMIFKGPFQYKLLYDSVKHDYFSCQEAFAVIQACASASSLFSIPQPTK